MAFGDTLRALIEERGLTQKELAERFHVAPSTMGCYVQGLREPDFATLLRLADYFGVSADYLLGHPTGKAAFRQEEELLRIFRATTPVQQEIYLDQGKSFLRANEKETASYSAPTSGAEGRAG